MKKKQNTTCAIRKNKPANYVMYGFRLSSPDDVGYLAEMPGKKFAMTEDIREAKLFPESNTDGRSGFGSPAQWLEFVNAELKDMFGDAAYVFHLVKTTL